MIGHIKKFFSKECKYNIEDLRAIEFYKKFEQKDLRRKVNILFIDDEALPIIDILKDEKFNISYKEDIKDINDLAAYNIICCDIRGIAKEKYPIFEGAYLIKEIKHMYPEKYVIAYTGSSYDPTYTKYLKIADDVIKKGTESEVWIDLLDLSIKRYYNPIEKWKKVRKDMLDENISTQFVADLEHEYVKAIKDKSYKSLEGLIEKKEEDNRTKDIQAIKTIISVIQNLFELWN